MQKMEFFGRDTVFMMREKGRDDRTGQGKARQSEQLNLVSTSLNVMLFSTNGVQCMIIHNMSNLSGSYILTLN